LCVASEEGEIAVYSLAEEDKGNSLFSMKLNHSIKEFGTITKIFYDKDVGLVISTFKGMLQVYDSMEFKIMWETTNSNRKEKITINTFDYSVKSGLIACGGVEGKIAVFDPSAKILTS
jgi:hypothetical protein